MNVNLTVKQRLEIIENDSFLSLLFQEMIQPKNGIVYIAGSPVTIISESRVDDFRKAVERHSPLGLPYSVLSIASRQMTHNGYTHIGMFRGKGVYTKKPTLKEQVEMEETMKLINSRPEHPPVIDIGKLKREVGNE